MIKLVTRGNLIYFAIVLSDYSSYCYLCGLKIKVYGNNWQNSCR
jgi:hypothetical protein